MSLPRAIRQAVRSLNLLATIGLLFVLFIMVNYLASRRYARWDLTRTKITALSDQTRQTLKTLKAPVSVIVFYQPTQRLYELIKDQLAEYRRANPLIQVEYVDPEQDIARAKQLAQELEIDALNLVVFKANARHKYLSDAELAEYEPGGGPFGGEERIAAFKAEEAFTSTILTLTQGAPPEVWVTTGHGEPSFEASDERGLSEFKRVLEQQNLSLKTVMLLEQPAIPSEVTLIIIPGPARRFHEREIGLLQAFLERGGSGLALIDPDSDTGLDGWLERWGIALGLDVVVDPERQLPFVSAANLLVTSYTEHPIVQRLRTLVTLFPLARSVQPASPAPEGVTVTPLANTSASGWGETQTSISKFQFDAGTDVKGPVSIAVAAERASPPHVGDSASAAAAPRTRLVAIGDSDFIINAQLNNVGNRDFAVAAVQWLVQEEARIGISPKPLDSVRLHLTGGQLNGLFWLSILAMPLGLALLGVLVWWTRRT
jgi:ABC-type uncharacterized transport system involved in gliding motility auxiliary subunit